MLFSLSKYIKIAALPVAMSCIVSLSSQPDAHAAHPTERSWSLKQANIPHRVNLLGRTVYETHQDQQHLVETAKTLEEVWRYSIAHNEKFDQATIIKKMIHQRDPRTMDRELGRGDRDPISAELNALAGHLGLSVDALINPKTHNMKRDPKEKRGGIVPAGDYNFRHISPEQLLQFAKNVNTIASRIFDQQGGANQSYARQSILRRFAAYYAGHEADVKMTRLAGEISANNKTLNSIKLDMPRRLSSAAHHMGEGIILKDLLAEDNGGVIGAIYRELSKQPKVFTDELKTELFTPVQSPR